MTIALRRGSSITISSPIPELDNFIRLLLFGYRIEIVQKKNIMFIEF